MEEELEGEAVARRRRQAMAARLSRSRVLAVALVLFACLTAGCEVRQGMWDQPRHEPLESTDFFSNGSVAREPVESTVAQGHLNEDDHFYLGKVDGQFVDTFPFPIDEEVMARGRERFNIYCAPCHDAVGNGNGMIVQRGYKRPPSYHVDRLRDVPVGYFYDVIVNGFGVMASYSYQIKPEDRWAVVAYVKALQLSQHAEAKDLPEADRAALEASVHP